ncbi:MAG: DEAD/DEAH box helicase [Planctomycetota bacterium]
MTEHEVTEEEVAEEEVSEEEVDDEAATPAEPDLSAAPEALQPALRRRGFQSLTAVQLAIAEADDGARDLRISSQTGSGKTVAIGLALLSGLDDPERLGPTTLVIAPTRELAMQVREELAWLFADQKGVLCEVVTGGTNIERERLRLKKRPAIVVGTPGRLLDHVRRGALVLGSVRQLVLDEADQMLDLGFKDELDAILDNLPAERRSHLVSATFPTAVLELANRFQRNPLIVEGTRRGSAHADIEHLACRINSREHYQVLVNLLLLAGEDRTLVFVRTREDTVRLADKLTADGMPALPLNGDLAQAQRTRTLQAFRSGAARTLIATDVAARGIDVPAVTMVVHMELPIDSETLVHRSGRTGRAGQKGRSVVLVPKARAPRTTRLFREAGIKAEWVSAPTAASVSAKQIERAEAKVVAALETAPVHNQQLRASAATLLQERDPIDVVARLLSMTIDGRKPFDLAPTPAPASRASQSWAPESLVPPGAAPAHQADTGPAGPGSAAPREMPRRERRERPVRAEQPTGPDSDDFAPQAPSRAPRTLGDKRGRPGAAASWKREDEAPRERGGRAAENGYTRFSINWGTRDGADARRILAHVCRRGGIDSGAIGSIALGVTGSTFDVADEVAGSFAQKVKVRDRRDPHLFINRDDGRRRPQPFVGGTEHGRRRR